MTTPTLTIAHVLHRLYLAGAEVLAADLARRLGDRYRFVFFCLDETGPLGKQLQAEGFEVVNLARKPGIDLSVARRLRSRVRELNVDLLHAHQYTPFFYAALSRRLSSSPPVLFTEHGRHYPDYRRPKRVWANKFLLRRRDRVTAVGQFVKQMLVDHEGLSSNRIDVIYNGIDPGEFDLSNTQATSRADIRKELNIEDSQIVLLQVARFHPVKDHTTAIKALAHAVQEKPDILLVLAGDGDEREAMERLAGELGVAPQVRFLGVRKDIPRLMAGADIFLLSSLSEGISVTLLEAMGSNLPIVTTDVGGNSELVVHQESGLLSPRGDAQSLVANIVALAGDPQKRQTMGQAGHTRLENQFTQQQMHNGYMRVYEQMLAKA